MNLERRHQPSARKEELRQHKPRIRGKMLLISAITTLVAGTLSAHAGESAWGQGADWTLQIDPNHHAAPYFTTEYVGETHYVTPPEPGIPDLIEDVYRPRDPYFLTNRGEVLYRDHYTAGTSTYHSDFNHYRPHGSYAAPRVGLDVAWILDPPERAFGKPGTSYAFLVKLAPRAMNTHGEALYSWDPAWTRDASGARSDQHGFLSIAHSFSDDFWPSDPVEGAPLPTAFGYEDATWGRYLLNDNGDVAGSSYLQKPPKNQPRGVLASPLRALVERDGEGPMRLSLPKGAPATMSSIVGALSNRFAGGAITTDSTLLSRNMQPAVWDIETGKLMDLGAEVCPRGYVVDVADGDETELLQVLVQCVEPDGTPATSQVIDVWLHASFAWERFIDGYTPRGFRDDRSYVRAMSASGVVIGGHYDPEEGDTPVLWDTWGFAFDMRGAVPQIGQVMRLVAINDDNEILAEVCPNDRALSDCRGDAGFYLYKLRLQSIETKTRGSLFSNTPITVFKDTVGEDSGGTLWMRKGGSTTGRMWNYDPWWFGAVDDNYLRTRATTWGSRPTAEVRLTAPILAQYEISFETRFLKPRSENKNKFSDEEAVRYRMQFADNSRIDLWLWPNGSVRVVDVSKDGVYTTRRQSSWRAPGYAWQNRGWISVNMSLDGGSLYVRLEGDNGELSLNPWVTPREAALTRFWIQGGAEFDMDNVRIKTRR